MKLNIIPVAIDLQMADIIEIQINALRLNDSAEIHVDFFKDKGLIIINGASVPNYERIAQKQFVIAGADYQAWNDDQYVIDYVMNKFGLTLAQ